MRIEKAELTKKIDKLKSVVSKNSHNPALVGVLVQDGYLIASNTEMTVKAKLEGIEGENFIIPAKAFDLIKNLPDGEVEITENNKNLITIKMGKIKNSYQSFPTDEYSYSADRIAEGGSSMKIQSRNLKESMAHVLYAVPVQNSNIIMTALYLEASNGKLNFVGLDGHVLAWDRQDFEGEFKLLLPRGAVEKLLTLEMSGEVLIEYDNHSAIFRSEGYEIFTRLIEGKYFAYEKIFEELPMQTGVKRVEMLDAITRAKICTDEKTPTKFEIEGDSLKLSIKDSTADYSEVIQLNTPVENLVIGFNSRLVLETIKAFSCEEISLSFGGEKLPMIVKACDSEMQAVVLPVQLQR